MKNIKLILLVAVSLIFYKPANAQEKLTLCEGINKVLSYYTTEANFEKLDNEFGTTINGVERSYKEYNGGFRFTMYAAKPQKGNYKTLFKDIYSQLVACTGDKATIDDNGNTKIAAFEYKGATIIFFAEFEDKKSFMSSNMLRIQILRANKGN